MATVTGTERLHKRRSSAEEAWFRWKRDSRKKEKIIANKGNSLILTSSLKRMSLRSISPEWLTCLDLIVTHNLPFVPFVCSKLLESRQHLEKNYAQPCLFSQCWEADLELRQTSCVSDRIHPLKSSARRTYTTTVVPGSQLVRKCSQAIDISIQAYDRSTHDITDSHPDNLNLPELTYDFGYFRKCLFENEPFQSLLLMRLIGSAAIRFLYPALPWPFLEFLLFTHQQFSYKHSRSVSKRPHWWHFPLKFALEICSQFCGGLLSKTLRAFLQPRVGKNRSTAVSLCSSQIYEEIMSSKLIGRSEEARTPKAPLVLPRTDFKMYELLLDPVITLVSNCDKLRSCAGNDGHVGTSVIFQMTAYDAVAFSPLSTMKAELHRSSLHQENCTIKVNGMDEANGESPLNEFKTYPTLSSPETPRTSSQTNAIQQRSIDFSNIHRAAQVQPKLNGFDSAIQIHMGWERTSSSVRVSTLPAIETSRFPAQRTCLTSMASPAHKSTTEADEPSFFGVDETPQFANTMKTSREHNFLSEDRRYCQKLTASVEAAFLYSSGYVHQEANGTCCIDSVEFVNVFQEDDGRTLLTSQWNAEVPLENDFYFAATPSSTNSSDPAVTESGNSLSGMANVIRAVFNEPDMANLPGLDENPLDFSYPCQEVPSTEGDSPFPKVNADDNGEFTGGQQWQNYSSSENEDETNSRLHIFQTEGSESFHTVLEQQQPEIDSVCLRSEYSSKFSNGRQEMQSQLGCGLYSLDVRGVPGLGSECNPVSSISGTGSIPYFSRLSSSSPYVSQSDHLGETFKLAHDSGLRISSEMHTHHELAAPLLVGPATSNQDERGDSPNCLSTSDSSILDCDNVQTTGELPVCSHADHPTCLFLRKHRHSHGDQNYIMMEKLRMAPWGELVFWHGYCNKGRPTLWILLGKIIQTLPARHHSSLLSIVESQRAMRLHMISDHNVEVSHLEYAELHKFNGAVKRMNLMMDLEGIGLMRLPPMHILQDIGTTLNRDYAGRGGTLFVLNAPVMLSLVLTTIQAMIMCPSQWDGVVVDRGFLETKDEILVLGKRYRQILQNHFGNNMLPSEFGGKCECPRGFGVCHVWT